MTSRPRVAVVGAGLAGLVAARHLAGGGLEVEVLERRATVGGRVRTLERDGYRFDRGFQVLFTAYPAVRRELDLEALSLRRFAPGAVIAGPNRRSTLGDPLGDPAALPATLASRNATLGDKLRVARLQFELRRRPLETVFDRPDESIAASLRSRGFSERFLSTFVAPFYGGITLDRSLSTSKRVFEYTFGALATGDIAVPAAGMGAIPAQLADHARDVGATLETGATVESVVDGGDDEVTIETGDGSETVDAVVVATDPPTASRLTDVDAIPTDGRGCVTQYYRLAGDIDLETGRRLLLNAAESGPNHVVPLSQVAPEYVPGDATVLSATYLGIPDADDETLAERTRRTLASWYPEPVVDEFELLHTDRIPFAQFAQPPGIHDRLPDARDPSGAVYLAGDYTRWSSIQGAMASGRDAAQAVIEDCSE
ncbi:NAD(P)/FAD-dependent oxidoreductase [Salinadaptatus halalkaliphilus]|uniref:NAD(P)/FAD-dependent oxidoreductase n=1 Tax=Salinadaptatus halalkaliphilus TaxID=2419781 RepID=A0A4S3TG11_9EURY|nr:NAD(P)/FAD-dependent oxidoreductase [Salinadaptatus halalkaliphilus]THE62811.1 NAD(P)/FAD-dependent oxidoreductase [Salinadaptatus halalkaliphilus]